MHATTRISSNENGNKEEKADNAEDNEGYTMRAYPSAHAG